MPKTSEYVSHKGEGMYPGAHPTAPGGMSQKALMEELVRCHGWTEAEAADYSAPRDWPDLIEQVIQERLNREAEASARYDEGPSMDLSDYSEEYLAQDHEPDVMAEFAEAKAEHAEVEREERQRSLLKILPDVLDYIFDGHMGAGPSGSHRWMTCTASLGASRKFLETLTPNQQVEFAKSNLAARQGTTAHAAAEVEAHVLLGQIERAEADATLLELSIMPDEAGEAYDSDMADYIEEYTGLVQTYIHDRGPENVLIEGRVSAVVPLTGLHEGEVYEITGSADCAVLPTEEFPDLVVADLKYGNGIDVSVEGNPQIRIYALGVLASLTDEDGNLTVDVSDLTYHIIQPRLGGIKTWIEPLDDLLDWCEAVLAPALTAALYGEAEGATFVPEEEACQFCPARGTCSALAEVTIEKAADLFDAEAEGFPETDTLTDERLGSLLTQINGVRKLYDSLKEEAQRRLFRGEHVPGWQLVNYTPPRTWENGAEEWLDPQAQRDEGAILSRAQRAMLWTDPQLLSPTKALALFKGNEEATELLTEIIEIPEKRPVVAPEGDRRKTWEGKAPEDMFSDEGEEE